MRKSISTLATILGDKRRADHAARNAVATAWSNWREAEKQNSDPQTLEVKERQWRDAQQNQTRTEAEVTEALNAYQLAQGEAMDEGNRPIPRNRLAYQPGPITHGDDFAPQAERPESSRPALYFRDQATGQRIKALEPWESVADKECPLGLGDYIVGRLRGNWDHLDNFSRDAAIKLSAAGEASFAAGGFFAPIEMSNMFLDLARSQTQVMRAGARTVTMSAGGLTVARLTEDPQSYWRGEGDMTPASQASFGQYSIRPAMLSCICPITTELMEDAPNIGSMIQNAIVGSMGSELDRAALLGATDGNLGPQGLARSNGINTVDEVGVPDDWTDWSTAIRKILEARFPDDVGSLSGLLSPREGGTYDGLVDDLGQPLRMPPWVAQVQKYYASAIPIDEGESDDESSMYVGFFPEMVFFIRRGLTIELLREGQIMNTNGDVDVNLTQGFALALRCSLRADVVVLRPSWFTAITGVKSTS